MNKKGQAAMEFLMTYGWAILVVIAAIAALAYFGVLDPAKLLPERCQSSAGMDCVDKAVITTNGVEMALRNNIGFPIEILNVNATGCDSDGMANEHALDGTSTEAVPVPNNGVLRAKVTGCTGLSAGAKFDETVYVRYNNTETGLVHIVQVDVRGKIA